MIRYSTKAAIALGFLKKSYNDVEVYVEDTSSQMLWTRLIQAILPAGIRLTSVNMLGGRSNVIEACRLDQHNDGRKKIYIIDGDFDYLLGKRAPKLNYFYRLKAYCVENILIFEDSVHDIAQDSADIADKEKIKLKLDLSSYLHNFEHALKSLFVAYATAHKLAPALTTVAYSALKLTVSHQGCPKYDLAKIKKRLFEITRAVCRAVGVKKFRIERLKVSQRANRLSLQQIVSGKDYLFPIIYQRLRKACEFPGAKQNLKIHLARTFKHQYEPGLSRAVRLAAR